MFGSEHTGFDSFHTISGVFHPALALDRQEFSTVYLYQYWDDEKAELVTSKGEATLQCISCGLGKAIIASGRQVPVGDLDTFGRVIAEGRRRSN